MSKPDSRANTWGMSDAEDIKAAIVTSATGPKIITVSGMGSSEEHSPADLIAADKHLANKNAAGAAAGFGLRFAKLNPPGTRS